MKKNVGIVLVGKNLEVKAVELGTIDFDGFLGMPKVNLAFSLEGEIKGKLYSINLVNYSLDEGTISVTYEVVYEKEILSYSLDINEYDYKDSKFIIFDKKEVLGNL